MRGAPTPVPPAPRPRPSGLRGLRGAGQRHAPGSARHLAASMKILRHRSLKGHGSWAHSSLPHLEGMQLPESAAVLGHRFGQDAGHGRPAGGAGRGPLAGGLPGATHWAARCTGVKGEGTGVAGGARARARGTDRLPGSPLHGAGRSCLCLRNLLVVPRSHRSGGSGDRAPPPGSRPGDTSQSRGCSRPRGLPQETRGSCRFAANAQVLEPE